MTVFDIAGDARRVFDVLKAGGIAIFPNDAGYAIMGGSPQALQKIFDTKRRGSHKRHAMLCSLETQREIHVLDSRSRDIIDAITVDYDLPFGAVAPYATDHPLLQRVAPELLQASTANGTIGMLLNAGRLYAELCRLSREAMQPIFGSSANLSGTGPKFRIEDIQPEIKAIADIIVDYGLRKYHHYNRSATIIRFPQVEVIRIGSCYELISDALKRHFQIGLPADPGRDTLPSGHLREFELMATT
ncbi:tRNA A37 threonylcarbamoyladenosine synthetase subunit TsaC/SUA5/YrdC [Enhydrobacter aerosaccus]|uniref:tRNA A37 threonylcarbamoyladenosine synthetase subunit TsaC/SUA5/YrdC n=1 Tax=Enhydrobacter aerosaccus TaxID=225324 RepID=A0A1T4K720_9HYPH|nr:Sua5/YciO/YrdC/YwlC family protein [Enhydrobacter aerosaccus]SJZ38211.1 tRNA A37 threonylcarbamoyladenosine synthetase subunit TsaC/SUA5/YrdC [Enhydrobacter aerosaccus]